MNDKFEQLMREFRKVNLGTREKETMRTHIAAFVTAHPRAKRMPWIMHFTVWRTSFAALGVFAVLGFGTSYAAEGALPKDLLYPVKVSINEKVRGFVAVSPRAQAAWASRKVERRLEEAEELASQGKLDANVKMELESRIEDNAKEADELIAQLDIEARAEASSELESTLEGHERVLLQISKSDGESASSTLDFAGVVKKQKRAVKKERSRTEQQIKSGLQKEKAAEMKLRAVERQIETVRENVGERAEEKLSGATELVSEGNAKLESGESGEAFILFQKAGREATKARIEGRAKKELKIEVDISLDSDATTTIDD